MSTVAPVPVCGDGGHATVGVQLPVAGPQTPGGRRHLMPVPVLAASVMSAARGKRAREVDARRHGVLADGFTDGLRDTSMNQAPDASAVPE